MTRGTTTMRPFAALREFARPTEPTEHCDVCAATLGADHAHLVEPAARRLACCCDACALLIGSQHDGRYRRLTPRLERLPDFRLNANRWASLGVPVNIVFFCLHQPDAGARDRLVVAVYPSPAGVIEEMVPTDAWDGLVAENPILNDLETAVEALLVNRVKASSEYYRASLDRCYELVGLVRKYWRGFSGGQEVQEQVERFFRSNP
jgi:uncharacterized protein DUF5947